MLYNTTKEIAKKTIFYNDYRSVSLWQIPSDAQPSIYFAKNMLTICWRTLHSSICRKLSSLSNRQKQRKNRDEKKGKEHNNSIDFLYGLEGNFSSSIYDLFGVSYHFDKSIVPKQAAAHFCCIPCNQQMQNEGVSIRQNC